MQLTTNSGLTGASFNASYRFICGDLSLTQSGHFSSIDRNQDGMYDTDINCTWMIKAEPYEMINLTLTYLDIREPPSGNCDTIQVRLFLVPQYLKDGLNIFCLIYNLFLFLYISYHMFREKNKLVSMTRNSSTSDHRPTTGSTRKGHRKKDGKIQFSRDI